MKGKQNVAMDEESIYELAVEHHILLDDTKMKTCQNCINSLCDFEALEPATIKDQLNKCGPLTNYTLIMQYLKKNIFRTEFKKIKDLIGFKKFKKFLPKNHKYLKNDEFRHKLRLNKKQFKEQVDMIHLRVSKYMLLHKLNERMKIESEYLKETIEIKDEYSFIWKSWLIWVRMIVNGANITDINIDWGLKYDTITKYLKAGFILCEHFYQDYFCSKKYWTPERLEKSTLSDYRVFLGYL